MMLVGRREIMLAKSIIEMPLPMPSQDYYDACPHAVCCTRNKKTVVLEEHVVAETLKKADGDCGVTCDGSYLFLSLFTFILAHTLECGDRDAQELYDDGCVDVWLDRESKYRCVAESSAGHYVHKSQDGALNACEIVAQKVYIYVRDRDCVTETVEQYDQKREKDLSADLFNLPSVT